MIAPSRYCSGHPCFLALLLVLAIFRSSASLFAFERPEMAFSPRWGASAGMFPDGKVIVSGGFDGKDTGRTEIYNPETGRWHRETG